MLLQLMRREPFPTEPLIMVLLFSQHKMIEWLTKQISKHESLINDNKEVEESKVEQVNQVEKIRILHKKE